MDQAKLENTQVAYPTGQQFYTLIKSFLPVNKFPQVTVEGMNKDPQLYVALVSVTSYLMGAKLIKNGTQFLDSEPMTALKDDTFGTYFENKSRAQCYKWLEQHK